MPKNIPIHGSMTRPGDVQAGVAELKTNALDCTNLGGTPKITFSTDEFTSVCPTTGQPDFSRIEVTYIPSTKYLESKAIKFWLWSFRDHGAHAERLAVLIGDHIVEAIDPQAVRVKVTQMPRGGITIVAEDTRGPAKDAL